MRFATWNVNSVRARVDRVVDFLDRMQVDVLAMQEIKCKPAQFPAEAFEAAGYELAVHGLNQWNGVAIASRAGLTDVRTEFPGQPAFGKPGQEEVVEARAIGATAGGIDIWSLYVPNGRALDDPHYRYKLDFLDRLRSEAQGWTDRPVALVGDWNVAPTDEDLYPGGEAEAPTHVTPEVREAFAAFEGAGYTELSRRFIPDQAFTYWDYKQLRFPRGEGLRIDFVYASEPLARMATGALIDREERKGKGASDHAPVIVDLEDLT